MTILEELKGIEERDGILHPKAVVDFARDPDTSLHNKFEWDDAKAGEQYRLEQARHIIRVQVTFLKKSDDEKIPVQAYHSLPDDRYAEGGYRSIVSILSDDDLRAKMLKEAKRELNTFKRKYQDLVELSSVFNEIERVLT